MLGQHCVKTWSSTQSIVSLSSAESEYYGVVKASSVGLGIQSMLRDMGIDVELEVLTDAAAASGIAKRKGLGGVRHIEVHYLWIQERIAKNHLKLLKVWGHENPADLLTKHLDAKTIRRYLQLFGIEVLEGRSAEAPELSSLVLPGTTSLCFGGPRSTTVKTPSSERSRPMGGRLRGGVSEPFS